MVGVCIHEGDADWSFGEAVKERCGEGGLDVVIPWR